MTSHSLILMLISYEVLLQIWLQTPLFFFSQLVTPSPTTNFFVKLGSPEQFDGIGHHVPQRSVQHIPMISPRFLQIGFSAFRISNDAEHNPNKKEHNTDEENSILPNMEASIKKPVLFQDKFMASLLFK